jgi:hypothetical protein
VWGDSNLAANSIIWGSSIVWSGDSMTALSDGEDGEN